MSTERPSSTNDSGGAASRPLPRPHQSSDSHTPSRRRASQRHRHSETELVSNGSRPAARHSLSGPGHQDPGQPAYQTLQEFLTQLEAEGGRQPARSSSVRLPREGHRPRRLHALSESGARGPDSYHADQYGALPRSPRVTGLRSPRSPTAFGTSSPTVDDESLGVHPGSRLSQATYIKPRWQPDAKVNACPICGRPFGFFFRKHHCRKCGRVVCTNCSPHRITIPKQFIVEPPGEDNDGGEAQGEVLSPSSDTENDGEQGLEDGAVFGGQEVRLCNPCVPDPQPPPPEYSSPPGTARDVLATFPPHVDGQLTAFPPRTSSQNRDWVGAYPAELQRHRSSTDPHRLGLRSPGLRPPTHDQQALVSGMHRMSLPPPPPAHSHPYGRSDRASRPGHRSGHSLGFVPGTPVNTNAPLPPVPAPVRRIAEEDECPICHGELPPKGPNGDETEREAHIASCIENSFSGNSRAIPGSTASTAPAPQASSVPIQTTSTAAGPSRPRAETRADPSAQYAGWRRSNMLVYKATEKDCLDAEGRRKECVICLDDFNEDDELGRLECWCTFHRKCIRSWWDQKGVGACPLHQHQEGL